ncbi:MAG: hypothetical protein IBX55_00675 [Methyloprofundus sp.]|nr:hypothetical protein [Methyloprofundus sp.]
MNNPKDELSPQVKLILAASREVPAFINDKYVNHWKGWNNTGVRKYQLNQIEASLELLHLDFATALRSSENNHDEELIYFHDNELDNKPDLITSLLRSHDYCYKDVIKEYIEYFACVYTENSDVEIELCIMDLELAIKKNISPENGSIELSETLFLHSENLLKELKSSVRHALVKKLGFDPDSAVEDDLITALSEDISDFSNRFFHQYNENISPMISDKRKELESQKIDYYRGELKAEVSSSPLSHSTSQP